MSTVDLAEYEQMLKVVRAWPASQRLTFAQELLSTLAPMLSERPVRNTLAQARGLLKNGGPTPSDEDIARLLDERRRERFGL